MNRKIYPEASRGLPYDKDRHGEDYIQWIDNLRNMKPHTAIESKLGEDELPHSVVKRILSNWHIPDNLQNELLYSDFCCNFKVDKNTPIYKSLSEIDPPNERGKEKFLMEASCIIDLGRILGVIFYTKDIPILRPSEMKEMLERTKKLKEHLNGVLTELKSMEDKTSSFFQDYLTFSAHIKKHPSGEKPTKHFINVLRNNAEWLLYSLGGVSVTNYLEAINYGKKISGVKKIANRRAMVTAFAESHYYCFGKMPTSKQTRVGNEANHFFDYIECIYESNFFPDYKPKLKIKGDGVPEALIKDIKSSIKFLKSRLR